MSNVNIVFLNNKAMRELGVLDMEKLCTTLKEFTF